MTPTDPRREAFEKALDLYGAWDFTAGAEGVAGVTPRYEGAQAERDAARSAVLRLYDEALEDVRRLDSIAGGAMRIADNWLLGGMSANEELLARAYKDVVRNALTVEDLEAVARIAFKAGANHYDGHPTDEWIGMLAPHCTATFLAARAATTKEADNEK